MSDTGRWRLRPGSVVLVLTAHPDDEVFAHGAAIADLSARGCRVVLRVASGGEAAEPHLDRVEARRRRADALSVSAARLGVAEWDRVGGWIDTGGIPASGSLTVVPPPELRRAMEREIRAVAPDLILTVGPDGLTGHVDHVRVHRAVTGAAAACAVPCFGSHLSPGDVAAGYELLRRILPGERVGSGRTRGHVPSRPGDFHGTVAAGAARRRALDAYHPGLGTAPLSELPRRYAGRGDSLLLRAVFDAVGWRVERYERQT